MVVLVTGSAKGIGKSTVIEFAKKGYDVVINYLSSEKEAKILEKSLKDNYSVNVLCIKGDMSKESDVLSLMEEVESKLGSIDILVNNASVSVDNYLEDKSVDEFKKVVENNLLSVFVTSKLIGRKMYNQKKGKIINVSSTNGIDTYDPISIDYDASKAGIISLTKNFSVEYAPYVNVNTVAPGWTNTESVMEMNPNIINEETKKILLKRFADPYEIAKVIVFLAGDDASYINGTVIRVDGGY